MTDPKSPMTAGQVYARLLRYAGNYWQVFSVSIIFMVVVAATEPAFAAMIKPMLDGSFVDKDPEIIRMIPFALVGLFLVRGFAAFLSQYTLTWVGRNIIRDMRKQVFDHLLVLPVSFFDTTPSGQLISKLIYDVEQVANAATRALTIIIRDSFTIVGLLAWMLYLNWRLSLFFLAVGPVIMLIVLYISKRFRRISKRIQTSMGDVTRVAQETVEGNRVIKTFGGQEYEQGRFNSINENNRVQNMKMALTSAVSVPLNQFIGAIAFAAVLFVVTRESMLETITVGTFMSFISALMLLFAPIKRLTSVNATLQRGIAAAQSVFELTDRAPEPDDGTVSLTRAQGRVEFRDVNFQYDAQKGDVLEHISFSMNPGETVALVGRSGSGKSTLVSLLPRFYQVASGDITVDGLNINDIKLRDLRTQISLVSQNISLFDDTIASNIAYGSAGFTEKDIIHAAEAAHCMEFISQLPQGLDTIVGENGVLLSGGQRQRLAIARALLKNAPILILDEATSALDTEAERHIQAALERLIKDRSTLVIAHRLSTIEGADKILVMDQGKLIEQGSHTQLLAADGVYAGLYRMQFQV